VYTLVYNNDNDEDDEDDNDEEANDAQLMTWMIIIA